MIYWAKSAERAYQDAFAVMLNLDGAGNEAILIRAMDALSQEDYFDFDQVRLSPNMEFYILGLSPTPPGWRYGFSIGTRSGSWRRISRRTMIG